MARNNITTTQIARLLLLLKSATEPIVAAELGIRLGLSGSRESQRRVIRSMVKCLRDNGSKIVATLQGGYWLTDDAEIWSEYLNGRKIDAKMTIGEAHRRQRLSQEASSQTMLFELQPAVSVDR